MVYLILLGYRWTDERARFIHKTFILFRNILKTTTWARMESCSYRVLLSKFSIVCRSAQNLVKGSITPEGITNHHSFLWIGGWMGPIIDLDVVAKGDRLWCRSLRHCTTSRKVGRLIPDRVIAIFD